MTRRLAGTVALVTGASSGIGEATARSLAAEGAALAVLGRRADRLTALAEELRADGATVFVVPADIADQAQAQDAAERTVAELGRLDTVVNNAGVMLLGPVADAPADEWRDMLAVNIEGMLHVTRSAIPHLVRAAKDSPRQVADLVNVSSTAGRVARPGAAVYSLTKFGVGAFSESLRQELQPDGVRVGVVEPGAVDTELVSHLREGIRESVEQQLGPVQTLLPHDIADAVAYIVTRDRRVAVNEMLVRAGAQTW
jgi:NADP-dependent 3-hydroxy acid dehydrogenase YdfG